MERSLEPLYPNIFIIIPAYLRPNNKHTSLLREDSGHSSHADLVRIGNFTLPVNKYWASFIVCLLSEYNITELKEKSMKLSIPLYKNNIRLQLTSPGNAVSQSVKWIMFKLFSSDYHLARQSFPDTCKWLDTNDHVSRVGSRSGPYLPGDHFEPSACDHNLISPVNFLTQP